MLLPVRVEIDLPVIPALDKTSIPAISAMCWCFLIKKTWIPVVPQLTREKILFFGIFVCIVITTLNNPEPFFDGEKIIRGLTLYDGISWAIKMYFNLIPFLLASKIVRTPEDIYRLTRMMMITGILYTPAILFEIRMSPQLHSWIYGFFPHTFNQMVRFDGFRPVVFIGHGLLVAILMVFVCGMTATFAKMRLRLLNIPTAWILLYLLIVLVLCKSVGAWMIGLVAVISILILPANAKQKAGTAIAMLIVMYPLISLWGWFPHDFLLEKAAFFGPDRVQSLEFRFDNEAALLQHARDKIYLGWGSWGRNRLFDSTVDGYLIALLGTSGMLGYLMVTGLVMSSILRVRHAMIQAPLLQEKRLISSLSILIALMMVDQIPNSSLTAIVWFFSGALVGCAQGLKRKKDAYFVYKPRPQPLLRLTN